MKKITIILVVVTVICHPLTATDVEKEYNQRRLSIEEKVGFFGSWGRFGGTVSSYQRWRYFQGFTEIKEPEFLDIAGYTDVSHLCEGNAKKNTRRDKPADFFCRL